MGLPTVTIEGRLGGNPELRFTPSGAAVCNFRVASTERRQNRDTQQWEDGRTIWLTVSCWRQLAENVAESLVQGDLVIVTGLLYEETFEQNGQQRTVVKVDAKTVSPSLASATARPQRTQRQGGGQPSGQQGQQQGQQQQGQQQGDPWAAAAANQQRSQQQQPWGAGAPGQQQQGGWQQPSYDEPPF